MTSILMKTTMQRPASLVSHTTDWGVSVSEATAEKTLAARGFALAGYLSILFASFLLIPILAGVAFFDATREIVIDLGIIGACIAVALYFNAQSRKGPKNALQVDYAAGEVRLGSITKGRVFVRHKVCPLRAIDTVSVDGSEPAAPALSLEMFGETATIRFTNTDVNALHILAARIQAAADEAHSAPLRTRIVSRINGFEAGVREIGERVRSRVTSSFA